MAGEEDPLTEEGLAAGAVVVVEEVVEVVAGAEEAGVSAAGAAALAPFFWSAVEGRGCVTGGGADLAGDSVAVFAGEVSAGALAGEVAEEETAGLLGAAAAAGAAAVVADEVLTAASGGGTCTAGGAAVVGPAADVVGGGALLMAGVDTSAEERGREMRVRLYCAPVACHRCYFLRRRLRHSLKHPYSPAGKTYDSLYSLLAFKKIPHSPW